VPWRDRRERVENVADFVQVDRSLRAGMQAARYGEARRCPRVRRRHRENRGETLEISAEFPRVAEAAAVASTGTP
jgi:hypothetical protein